MRMVALVALGIGALSAFSGVRLYKNPQVPIDQRVEDLLMRMTPVEKAGQLTQAGGLKLGVHGMGTNINEVALGEIVDEIRAGRVGSYIIKMRQHKFGSREMRERLQKISVEKTRLGIPLLFADDMVHGVYTCFPNALGLACSFEPELFEQSMRCEAIEARWAGFDWVYGPVADTARDPRWGRVAEGCGEDPYLNGLCIAAAVRGLQGDGNSSSSVIATPKHFVGYSDSMGGRDYNVSEFSEWTLRNLHLPPFRAAVEEGALSVMSGFNTIDGIPASHCRHTLTEILREQWGFAGFVISDAGGLPGGVRWNYCIDGRDSALRGLQAGADVEMYRGVYIKYVPELVAAGLLDGKCLDESVRRVLRVKFQRGLFENPYLPLLPDEATMSRLEKNARQLAKTCALRSVVLLKNTGVLPLGRTCRNVAVVGPYSDNAEGQIGCWSGLYKFGGANVRLCDAIQSALGPDVRVVSVRGCDALAGSVTRSRAEDGAIVIDREGPKSMSGVAFDDVKRACTGAEIVIMAIGEPAGYTGEGGSRATLGLTGRQQELFDFVVSLGKPIVSVITAGRPLAIPDVYEKSSAVLYSFFLGCEGHSALGDILAGTQAPEGRLSVSVPQSVGHLPCFYNRYNTGHPGFKKYRDAEGGQDPLYPFGFGLTYSKVVYASTVYDVDAKIARCEISNVGPLACVEKAQLYVRQLACHEGVRPVRELRGIRRVVIKPGERIVVSFPISDKTLRYHNRAGGYSTDHGNYELKISPDAVSGKMIPFVW